MTTKRKLLLLFIFWLILTVSTGLISFLFYPSWLLATPLLAIAAAAAALGILDQLGGGLSFIDGLFSSSDYSFSDPSLIPTTPAELLEPFGLSAQVNWIDRGVSHPDQFYHHRRIIITAPMKYGKSREAVRLIDRAILQGIIPATRIFSLNHEFLLRDPDGWRRSLRSILGPNNIPILIFIDDLPQHYKGKALDLLSSGLSQLNRAQVPCYIVATARLNELSDEQHQPWLKQQEFHVLELPPLNQSQTTQLISDAAATFNQQLAGQAAQEFIAHSDGSPEYILINFYRFQTDQISHVDQATAHKYAQDSLAAAWSQLRNSIQDNQPLARYLFTALDTFHAANIIAYTPLVLHYAAHVQHHGRHFYSLRNLQQALVALSRAHDRIAIERNQIMYPDILCEDRIESETAQLQLRGFMQRHRRHLQHRGMRRFYGDALPPMMWAFFEFDVLYFEINRGLTYSAQGDLARAIADYDKAIELNPQDATAYNNRGITYHKLGQFEDALADYERAIQLNPEYATAYNNRGITYDDLGQFEDALADYERAIQLNPADATAFYNRGTIYHNLGQFEDALADYDRAIQLNPLFPYSYNNLGDVYLQLGRLDEARSAFQERVRLAPDNALAAQISLGVIAFHQDNAGTARQHFERALAIWDEAWRQQLQSKAGLLENKAIALLALNRPQEAISAIHEALAQRLPGDTTDFYLYELLLDSAHSPPGLEEIMSLLRQANDENPASR